MQMASNLVFLEGNEFMVSVRNLYQKGGLFQKAAQAVQAAWGRAHSKMPFDEVFAGVAKTNHGENRIPHCIKFDLTKFSRLVVVLNNGTCLFLYCGDHATVDRWLDRNRGLDFVAKQSSAGPLLQKIRVSDTVSPGNGLITTESDLSNGPLIKLLPERYFIKLIAGLAEDTLLDLKKIESITSDDEIQNIALTCGNAEHQFIILDVLLSLKSGDVLNAKSRIDTWTGQLIPVVELKKDEIERIQSSDSAIVLQDVDPVLFKHFVETASFEQWMLYLHPAQRENALKNFEGPARLAGVSGSGKTCVVVHRALRLAELYPDEPILVVTLSDPLAGLIDGLITAARGSLRPKNIKVSSIFQLCFEKLMQFEPDKKDYYTRKTVKKNPFAASEDVEEIWREYFYCENNNNDADVMLDVIKTLAVRSVYASDYLRQELDYIRSSFRPGYRAAYLKMAREGRVIGLEERYRLEILDGLDGWERKMEAVGVVDDMGIVTALSRRLLSVKPEFRCTLVDEVQDLGTLELSILRRLTKEGANDLFLCGDSAQKIHTKHADLKSAGIELENRILNLNQNYRNSRQILDAAYQVLSKSLELIPGGTVNVEVLPPEYANFSSPKPLLLRADKIEDEIRFALGYLNSIIESAAPNQKYCMAVCGYSHTSIEKLATQLDLPALNATTNIHEGRIFISDLEQTKGFEFDVVVLINCSATCMPHPQLPEEESFRDLSRLYVAMTRAKTQLLVSYSGQVSKFIALARDAFVDGDFEHQAEPVPIGSLVMPDASIPKVRAENSWRLNGIQFLKTLDAVGLPRSVQDMITSAVTGRELIQGSRMKQKEWKDFNTFYRDMQNPRNRNKILSPEAWDALYSHFG